MIKQTIKYGRLTLVSLVNGKGKARGVFKCDCGNEVSMRMDSVKSKEYPSCGCWGKEIRKEKIIDKSEVVNMVGMKFGRLLVTAYEHNAERVKNIVRLVCLCDCGAQRVVRAYQLKNGTTRSCGCIQREWAASQQHKDIRTKHGHTANGSISGRQTSIYVAWVKIMKLCKYERGFSYQKVCHDYDKRWDDFEEFFKDFGNIRNDQTISRYDNKTSWCKNNCYIKTTEMKGTS